MFSVKGLLQFTKALGLTLLLVIIFGNTASAQDGPEKVRFGKLSGKVEINPAVGNIASVRLKLYRVQSGCCDPCKQEPKRPCRDCGCLLLALPIALTDSGTFQVTDLPPGTYEIINEVNGRFAGFDSFVEIRPNKEKKLGTLIIDAGYPNSKSNLRRDN